MRHLIALSAAAATLTAAVFTGLPAQAEPGGPAKPVGQVPSAAPSADPDPGGTAPPSLKTHPYRPVPASKAKPAPATPPDFGPHERVFKAFHAGKLSRDDAVRYGLAALESPARVPARLRPTGKISNPQAYLTYLSMLSKTASPGASQELTKSLTAAAAPAAADGYDDCAAADYDYLGTTYKCQAWGADFVVLFNIGGSNGIPAVYNTNGRATAVQQLLDALSIAADEYRAMGYTLPVRDSSRPYAYVYGVNSIGPANITAPFTVPSGLNQQPTILVPSGWNKWDSLPRHELFHAVQYQYWDNSSVLIDLIWSWVGGDEFGSMNWWMEATAEWAAHQTYLRFPHDPLGQSHDYADGLWSVLAHPSQPLNKWGGLGGGPQYGSFLFAQYATERTDINFVRHTWEGVRDHDYLPIEAIRATMAGYGPDMSDLLLSYYIANYRMAAGQAGPPTSDWSMYGYADPDVKTWRSLIDGLTDTADDGLGGARPARTLHNLPAGQHFDLHNTVYPGGAVYHDFWAQYHSGDQDCDYCSTLLVDTSKDTNRRSAIIVWSSAGSSGIANYPGIVDIKYPDAGGLITVNDFRYPMVASLVSVRTELEIHSGVAIDEPTTFDTYVETTAPLKERSCSLKAPIVQSLDLGVSPESLFNSYAASTPDGWTGGDSTYSVELPDGRIVWLFSDTFLGPLNSDGTRPTSAKLVNSTFLVQSGTSLTTIRRGTAAVPQAIMPPESDNRWFWIGDGHMSGGKLQVVFQEYEKFGPGSWDFRFHRNVVADFDTGSLGIPQRVRDLPSDSGVAWGSALLPASRSGDGYTYVYGVDDSPINKQMRIARVYGDDLAGGTWQYYTPWGWSFREQNARNTLTGIANEYSVTPWNGQFLLLSQDSTEAFSGRIMGYTSCSPFGPFTNRNEIYRMPEPGPYGSYWDGDIIAYNAHVHAELSTGNVFLASYNVNSMDNTISSSSDHYRDPGIYRPRFFRFSLG